MLVGWILAGLCIALQVVVVALVYKKLSDRPDASWPLERLARLERELSDLRTALQDTRLSIREGIRTDVSGMGDSLRSQVRDLVELQSQHLQRIGDRMEGQQKKLEHVRETVEHRLHRIEERNEKKLDEIREVVDEKLRVTLEDRLGATFRSVSERLDRVHKSLGEVHGLAQGVGDLKRVLGNVKVRGTWGEVQLGRLLEQVLAPQQFAENVQVSPDLDYRVEYAIRVPRGEGGQVWLPIDSKFPTEDFERLLAAEDAQDNAAKREAGKALESRLVACAKDIAEKYIRPPDTTSFGLLFLPTEGLYAEALRRPGLVDRIQREYRVILSGPTTLAALLNSLQVGFRTVAIEQRATEVWQVLGAVKTEFNRFGEVLGRIRKKLAETGNYIDRVETRTRVMQRKLKDVEELPQETADVCLGLPAETDPAYTPGHA